MAGRDSEIAGTAGTAAGPAARPADPPLAAGAVIDGRYRVVAELGAGGMGRVYEAEHMFLRRRMALKLLRRGPATTPEAAARLVQEATLAGQVPHPAVVRVFDCAVLADGQVYLAMELLRGESLEQALRRPIAAAEIVSRLAEVARGLAAVHRVGVVHRDIKPANIFLARDEAGVQAKLLDFGVAKVLPGASAEEGVQTQAGAVLGTPHYLAPEQARGGAIDGRADLYAIGVILYEALTGSLPFVGASFLAIAAQHLQRAPLDPRQAAPERAIPDGVARLTMRLLAKAPEQRASDGEALAEELVGLLGAEGPALARLMVGTAAGRQGLAEGTGGGAEAETRGLVEGAAGARTEVLAEGTGGAAGVRAEAAGARTEVLAEVAGARTEVLAEGTGAGRLAEGTGAGRLVEGAGAAGEGLSSATYVESLGGSGSRASLSRGAAGRSRVAAASQLGPVVGSRGPWFVTGVAGAAIVSAAIGWTVVRAASRTEEPERVAPAEEAARVAPAEVRAAPAAVVVPVVAPGPAEIGASGAAVRIEPEPAKAAAVTRAAGEAASAKSRPGKKRPRGGGTTAAQKPPIVGGDPPLKPDVYDE